MKSLIIPTNVTEIERRRCGIYVLWDNIKHRVYVGQTCITFRIRWCSHEKYPQSKYGTNHIKNVFKKYGKENFEWDIIETLPSHLEYLWFDLLNTKHSERNKNEEKYEPILAWLDKRETYWIEFYRNLLGIENVFNIQDGGRKGTRKFIPYDDNARKNMSKSGIRRFARPDERIKQSKRISKYFEHLFAIPGEREKFSAKRSAELKRSYAENPEYALHISIGQKKSYEKHPERRINMSKVQLIVQGKQEVHDKKSKSMTGIKWTNEALENRAKGIHESNKQKHQELDAVLWLAEQVNPHIKYQSRIFKKYIISKIIEELRWLKCTSLTYDNVYDILERCNLLKHRFRSDEFDGSIYFNTYFVIKQYT